jgi:hypothetical protein
MAQHTVEVWVMVDADGNAVASHDADLLGELYDDHVGNDAGTARRVVKVELTVAVEPIVLRGTVPAEPEGVLNVVA